MKSIMDSIGGTCFICGQKGQTERHHCFGGAYRKVSEKYGLVVHLCHACHNEPPAGVHFNGKEMLKLKQQAQERFMQISGFSTQDFRELFGKNYL